MTEHHIDIRLEAPDILSKMLLARRDQLVFQGHNGLSLSEVARIVILESLIMEHQYHMLSKQCRRCECMTSNKLLDIDTF